MAQNVSLNIPAHYNIYTGKSDRNLRIEFSIPNNGTNEDTGLVVLVPGFGAHIDSKVYAKMRDVFADQYNLITIQCEYFGSSFMQGGQNLAFKNPDTVHQMLSIEELRIVVNDPSKLMQIISSKSITVEMVEKLNESIDEFNDMGFMQAIDIITAVEATKICLTENNLSFNKNRSIGYGHSHGAFLLHLCNRLSPAFSFIIDNSAWLEPVYLHSNRVLSTRLDQANLLIEFNYIAKEILKQKSSLNLRTIYKNFNNHAQIVSFQGDEDQLVNHVEKQAIISSIHNAEFFLVTSEQIDHKKFKSNKHGLDANFLELFSYALELEKPIAYHNQNSKFVADMDSVSIEADYTNGLPVFNFL